MRTRGHRIARLLLVAIVFAMAPVVMIPRAAMAQRATPVITTPTPHPLPTPDIPTARELLALTPEADRHGSIGYFPLTGQNADSSAADVIAGSFTYTIQSGETLWSLALDFRRDLDTMSCVTTPNDPQADLVIPGQMITIPALDDLCYTVTPGDTLSGIAARHGLSVDEIVAVKWNGFTHAPFTVVPRQRVLLPGARVAATPRRDRNEVSIPADDWAMSAFPDWPYGDGDFVWPVTGPISQYAHAGHWALDIAVPTGTPVVAADRGTVIMAGWSQSGYGFRVVIDHGNDYVTLYAHLSDIYVETGDVVAEGQVIATTGANGNVTGPHLHFEIRDFGMLTDPLSLLPH